MERVVIVSSIDPAPLFLTTLPYVGALRRKGAQVEVILTTPSYPLWEWPGWDSLGLSEAELVFIGDVLTPRSLFRFEAFLEIAGSAVVVTGPHCARLLRKAPTPRSVEVYDYREFASSRGIPQQPEDVGEAVSKGSWRMLALSRYIFAEVLESPRATEWAAWAAERLESEGAGFVARLAEAHLARAVNVIEDLIDTGESSREVWGEALRVFVDSLQKHALLSPIAARAARRVSSPVLAYALNGGSGWASMALYDPQARGGVSSLARALERAGAEGGGYPTCGRYSVELTVRTKSYERVLTLFREYAASQG